MDGNDGVKLVIMINYVVLYIRICIVISAGIFYIFIHPKSSE